MIDGRKLNGIIYANKNIQSVKNAILEHCKDDNDLFLDLLDYMYRTCDRGADRLYRSTDLIIEMNVDSRFKKYLNNENINSKINSIIVKLKLNGMDFSYLEPKEKPKQLGFDDIDAKILKYCKGIQDELNDTFSCFKRKSSAAKVKNYIISIQKILPSFGNGYIMSDETYNLLSKIIYSQYISDYFRDCLEFKYIYSNIYKFRNTRPAKKTSTRMEMLLTETYKKKLETPIEEVKEEVKVETPIEEVHEEVKVETPVVEPIQDVKPKTNILLVKSNEFYYYGDTREENIRRLTIRKKIINLLLNNKYINEDKMLFELAKEGYVVSLDELRLMLRDLDSFIGIKSYKNFDNGKFSSNHTITKAIDRANQIPFSLKNRPNTSVKMLLIADRHYQSNTLIEDIKKDNDVINEYCSSRGIHLIFDLGDVIDENYANASDLLRFSDNFLQANYLSDGGFIYAILGGNHDSEALNSGVNMLEYLACNSNNIINLGYTFNSVNTGDDSFYLIHPNSTILYINSFTNYDEIISKINDYVKCISSGKCNLGVASGHFHSRMLVPGEGIAMVGNGLSGCVEMEFVYNEKGEVSYIIFTPVDFNKKLIASNTPIIRKIKR